MTPSGGRKSRGLLRVPKVVFAAGSAIAAIVLLAEQPSGGAPRLASARGGYQLIGEGRLPTGEDLKEFPSRHKGWILEVIEAHLWNFARDPFDRPKLVSAYERHNGRFKNMFDIGPSRSFSSISPGRTLPKEMAFLDIPFRGEKCRV